MCGCIFYHRIHNSLPQWQLEAHVRLMTIKLHGVCFHWSKGFCEAWSGNRPGGLDTLLRDLPSLFIGQQPSQSGDFPPFHFPARGSCQSPQFAWNKLSFFFFFKGRPKEWIPFSFPGFSSPLSKLVVSNLGCWLESPAGHLMPVPYPQRAWFDWPMMWPRRWWFKKASR